MKKFILMAQVVAVCALTSTSAFMSTECPPDFGGWYLNETD